MECFNSSSSNYAKCQKPRRNKHTYEDYNITKYVINYTAQSKRYGQNNANASVLVIKNVTNKQIDTSKHVTQELNGLKSLTT